LLIGFHWVCPARIIEWHDGDTCRVDLDLGWRIIKDRENIRLLGLYCAELSEPGGYAARDHATHLAPPGTIVVVTSKKLGKVAEWTGSQESLSRTLGDITLPDGRDFATTMVADGHGKAAA
jgi:endonuclease YncB( thermonuclease family)